MRECFAKEELFNTLQCKKRYTYEYSFEISVVISLIHIRNMKIFLYGEGQNIGQFIRYLTAENIEILGIIDRDENKCNKFICDVPIISIDSFMSGNSFSI